MSERLEKKGKKRRLSTHARIVRYGAEGDAAAERSGAEIYDFYDSPAESFDAFFSEVLAPYASIRDYMEAYYGRDEGTLRGVELGGPGRALFAELNRGRVFKRTAGFVLHDGRSGDERAADQAQGHDVVEADVFFRQGADGLSWNTVEKWVDANGKPDLVIERMVQGVDQIRRADLYVAIVKRWLSRLSEDGTLLAEVPRAMPMEERRKVFELLSDDSFDMEEAVPNADLTALLLRRS